MMYETETHVTGANVPSEHAAVELAVSPQTLTVYDAGSATPAPRCRNCRQHAHQTQKASCKNARQPRMPTLSANMAQWGRWLCILRRK